MDLSRLHAELKRCLPEQAWPMAERSVRAGQVALQARSQDEWALTVVTPQGKAFTVLLWPRDAAWECPCPAPGDACVHVAAACLAAMRGGEALRGDAAQGSLLWRVSKAEDGRLRIERWVRRGAERVAAPLDRPLPGGTASTDEDAALARLASGWASGLVPRAAHKALIKALAAVPGEVAYGDGPVTARTEPIHLVVRVDEVADGFRLSFATPPEAEVWVDGDPPLVVTSTPREIRPVGTGTLSENQIFQLNSGVMYTRDEGFRLGAEIIPALEKRIRVVRATGAVPVARHADAALRLELSRKSGALEATLRLVYGDPPLAHVVDGLLAPVAGALSQPTRDKAREERLIALAARALEMRPGETRRMAGADAARFLSAAREAMPEAIQGLEGVETYDLRAGVLEPFWDEGRTGVGFRLGDGVADAAAVVAAWQAGDDLAPLVGGGWAEIPKEWMARQADLLADLVAASGGGEAPLHALPVVESLKRSLGGDGPPPDLAPLARVLAEEGQVPSVPLPEGLRAEVRAYQKRGHDWLRLLGGNGLGGVLADDMGLGKTLQALAALLAWRGEGPALVVAPTSVLANWRAEAERFAPDLDVVVLHGPSREAGYARLPAVDIAVTSYALLRLDLERLLAVEWGTVVLDEAQAIKNPRSQTAAAARRLGAARRFALTGTPIENHLSEVWSLMEFLNPGFFGPLEVFERRYASPVAAGDARAAAALRGRLRPFVLRRLKREVAPELPPRTEVVLRAQFGETQRELYEAVRRVNAEPLLSEIASRGLPANRIQVLALLTRLRQVCCHPGLLPGGAAEAESAKLDLFMETLEQVIEEGHRSLVFSQFTRLLDLVEPRLGARGIGFLRLDGSTRDRASLVSRFQAEDGPPVFLISLKAGGSGLNLTAADHVFHLDPWWNPAVEDQATDRAHRIGQERPVIAYKLVAEDTVEERILALQERKRALAEAMLGGDEAAWVDGLTGDDLQFLLGGIG